MRRRKALLLAVGFALLGCDRTPDSPRTSPSLGVGPPASQSLGCACDYEATLAELYARHALVALAVVTDARPITPEPRHNQETRFRIFLQVLESWRGSLPPELAATGTAIYHSPFEDSRVRGVCEPAFVPGRSYLIFTDPEAPLEFVPCSAQIRRASDDLIHELRTLAAGSTDVEL